MNGTEGTLAAECEATKTVGRTTFVCISKTPVGDDHTHYFATQAGAEMARELDQQGQLRRCVPEAEVHKLQARVAELEGELESRVAELQDALDKAKADPPQIWINAMKCVAPSDDFLKSVGSEIVTQLMRDGKAKVDALDPYRTLVVKVVCS